MIWDNLGWQFFFFFKLYFQVSKLQLSPSSSAKTAQQEHTLSVPDWSLLPEEILNMISKNVKDCFDAIHARSVCTLWRSTFSFPSCLLRTSYSLPYLSEFPGNSKGLCSLERFPMFLFRVRSPPTDLASPSEFFSGRNRRRWIREQYGASISYSVLSESEDLWLCSNLDEHSLTAKSSLLAISTDWLVAMLKNTEEWLFFRSTRREEEENSLCLTPTLKIFCC